MSNDLVHPIFQPILKAISGDLAGFSSMDLETTREVLRLYRKHVGSGALDLFRLRDVLRHEVRIAEQGIVSVTPCLLTELRAERNYVGRVITEHLS